ncbi:hypothetical protein METBIDRAFT_78106 [Metschnikowia bicuspidata var. bicuspidata NRRL YB-4993]|uniref:CDP-diacylglycerol--glycerol-3-phosphate 3-phosphatidyltransferase n=1 Tax=Metschnikowia bicuspidata var. bicuspidata NRRL YB-4993 TaxID=869754 RepID=A0A1A0HAG8_9ASCO|nr:hypothetical protein METBIDRAFT_78106 [Metschnikowia bicuspidata var. bicuspidata NRRL YB-4993]OBA21006.1 hypothetical protein METBIDRAFT_78106 [Metschnikowia bicuspidata var. bicuspidata NRRL YB-4993]
MIGLRVISHRPARLITPRASFSTSACRFEQIKKPSLKKRTDSSVEFKRSHGPTKPAPNPKLDISAEIYTIPNMLTISRIATTPFIGYFLATGQSFPAIAIFTYSCVTDFADGFIARKYNMKSVLGSVLDPAADKFLMTTCTVALAIPGVMPLYAATAIVGRDVILSFVSFYIRYRSLPPPVTLRRFLDLSISTHTVHPNFLGKANTALQMLYIGGLVLKPAIESLCLLDLSGSFDWFGMAVAASTVCSGLSYVVGKNSFKSIGKSGAH